MTSTSTAHAMQTAATANTTHTAGSHESKRSTTATELARKNRAGRTLSARQDHPLPPAPAPPSPLHHRVWRCPPPFSPPEDRKEMQCLSRDGSGHSTRLRRSLRHEGSGTEGNGAVLAARAADTQGKCTALAATAVDTQVKGAVSPQPRACRSAAPTAAHFVSSLCS